MLQRETTETVPLRAASMRPRAVGLGFVRRLRTGDRRVLGMWAGAHLALAVISWMTASMNGKRGLYAPLLGNYAHWDTNWYVKIAAHGYFSGRGAGPDSCAFFPGFPLALSLVHLLVRNWTVAGLLISLVAGGVALCCLRRLGGEIACLHLLTAPAAMYLLVGYSESLFLAFALPAWLAAQRRDWLTAGLLGAFAGLVRIDGVFLAAALILAAATSRRGQRLRATAWSLLALTGPGLYEVYLWAGSGSWGAWQSASQHGWGLHFVGPWRSLQTTWGMAFGGGLAPDHAVAFQVELAAMVVAVALTLALLWRREWPEAVYCGLAVVALGTTTYYQSVPRALLLMWPLYVLAARAADRRAWVGRVYLWSSAPLAVVVAMLFFLDMQPV